MTVLHKYVHIFLHIFMGYRKNVSQEGCSQVQEGLEMNQERDCIDKIVKPDRCQDGALVGTS